MARYKPAMDILCEQADITMKELVRRTTYRRKLTPKQLRNRIATLRGYARHGCDNQYTAEQLAAVLKCDSFVFLWGYEEDVRYQAELKRLSEVPQEPGQG